LIEIRSLAETVLGNAADAEEWLNKPAIALDGIRPLDLLMTRTGAVLVKDLLIRLDHCVTV
jgi:putative toxin-antitoxin system antitoxin component (TIGR02293 family)